MIFKRLTRTALILVALAALSSAFWARPGSPARAAQGWSDPINLSETSTSSNNPSIAADSFGMVHVFWSEDLGGPPFTGQSAPGGGNAILYRRYQDHAWTAAIDLFYNGTSKLDRPAGIVDSSGTLHLVWLQDGILTYSYAKAWDATHVRAWSAPITLVGGTVGRVSLVESGGQFLAVFTQISGSQPGIYALPLSDDPSSLATLVWPAPPGMAPMDFSAAVDGKQRIHLAWSVMLFPDPGAVEAHYAVSEDQGLTWSDSFVFAKQASDLDSLQFAVPWVVARGDDEIHLQWAQGERAYRWHRYSSDGGKTWRSSYQIWPDLLSQTNSQAAAADQDGNLYWADVLRYPNAGYLMRWTGREWSFPEMFYLIQQTAEDPIGPRVHIHAIRMAISLGNELFLVYQDQNRAEIWLMSSTLPSSGMPAQSIPEPTPQPALLTPGEVTVETPAALPTVAAVVPGEVQSTSSRIFESPSFLVLGGIIPTTLLTFALILIRMKRHG